MVLAPAIPSDSPPSPHCSNNPASPGSSAPIGDCSLRTAQPLQPGQIVLLDTIGELASVYSLAAVAFVGGSLVPAGGHNPLEPAQFGVPIVMGPHYANFRAIAEDLLAHQRPPHRHQRRSGRKRSSIAHATPPKPPPWAQRARQVFEQQAGATDRCVERSA